MYATVFVFSSFWRQCGPRLHSDDERTQKSTSEHLKVGVAVFIVAILRQDVMQEVVFMSENQRVVSFFSASLATTQ